ncbi:MAG: cupin domain-containing protein [Acidimicrobiales bacterium]
METDQPFFYDVAELPGHTIVDLVGGSDGAEELYDLFGRDLVTRTILQSPALSVYHETAQPGERVKPHRHGTHQLTYVLRGELIYGSRRTTAGMGHFSPDTLYSWRAGDDGAEWIEIHAGQPGIYTDRRGD